MRLADELRGAIAGCGSARSASASACTPCAMANARRMSSTVALGTVPTSAPVYGLRTSIDAVAADALAGDAHLRVQHVRRAGRPAVRSSCSWRRDPSLQVVEREVERVEVAPAAPAGRSPAARLAISGTRCSETPPCERSGASRPDRSCRSRLVPITVRRSETTTRSPTRSARQLEARAGLVARAARGRCRAALRCARRHRRAATGRRQIDGRERAERAVMDDVGIGDRQDHARRARAVPARRAGPAGTRCWAARTRRSWRSSRGRRSARRSRPAHRAAPR